MTKKELKKKCKELFKKYSLSDLDKSIEKLINQGAIDYKTAENNYLLPKIIITAVYEELAYQCRPLHHEHREELKNIKCFSFLD